MKTSIFGQHCDVRPDFGFFSQIFIFGQKFDFWPKV